MRLESNRTGYLRKNSSGYESFVPNKLPPNPQISIDEEMQKLLSDADRKLGRLDGITQILPNPELFVAMYVKKEAVLSAQIEGTQASLVDVLNESVDGKKNEFTRDGVIEVVNYVNALNFGLKRINELPLSLRLIREIHGELLKNVRGSNKNPGEFRTSQNWIGPAGCNLSEAAFIPPNPSDMEEALGQLEEYFYDVSYIPQLIKIAIIHAQFETIHPFLDGNGRMGRLLITFWLCNQKILSKPLLYLSYYFKYNRAEYYQRLMDVRLKGDWENWIKFFLRGVSSVSDEATESAKKIIGLQQKYAGIIEKMSHTSSNYTSLLNSLFDNPIITKADVTKLLGVSTNTASSIVDAFCEIGILHDYTPNKQRYKEYVFTEYLNILRNGTDL